MAGAVRAKICGVTTPEDARLAAEAGADALGAVFSPGFPTSVSLEEGGAIWDALPPFVTKVALFVDPEASLVRQVIKESRPDLIQFHGEEEEEFCSAFSLPYLKACRVRKAADIIATMESHGSASGFLLDGFSVSAPGGTGSSFDWSLMRGIAADKPLVVAGGLTPGNVASAIEACAPYGVDVSSGVARTDCRRRKDPEKVRSFIENVRAKQG